MDNNSNDASSGTKIVTSSLVPPGKNNSNNNNYNKSNNNNRSNNNSNNRSYNNQGKRGHRRQQQQYQYSTRKDEGQQKFFNPKYSNNNNNKISLSQIESKFPQMIKVDLSDAKKHATNQQANRVLQQAYKFAQQHGHQNPLIITKLLRQKDKAHLQMYSKLRVFCTRRATTQKLKKFLASKIIHQYSVKNKVPHKQALCTLLMDDFFTDLKQFGGKAFQKMKQYYHQNKDTIHDMLGGLVTSVFPQAAPIVYGLKTAFGGQLMSQSPYAIDIQYMKSLFSDNGTAPAPRMQNHYMYHMASNTQYAVTTNASGQTTIVICPYSCINGVATVNGTFLPFLQNNALPDATRPYSAINTLPGPFNSQNSNIVNYAVDNCKVNFINTQSSLNVKGKMTVSVFYQSPNATWTRDIITGLYNTGAISITDMQLIANDGYFRRHAQKQAQTLTRLATLLPQQNRDNCISRFIHLQASSQFMSSNLPFIIIKFVGCNPSTQIGTLFIQMGISIQPIAALRNILKVTPRGSFQGVYRCIKQCRKLRIPLQFLKQHQATFLFRQAFNEIDFKQIQYGYGSGQYIPIPGLQKLQYNQTPGSCLHDSILALGILNNLQPYDTLQHALNYTSNLLRTLSNKQIIIYNQNLSNQFVYLNQQQKHAVAVDLKTPIKFKQFLILNQILVAYYDISTRTFSDYTQQFLQYLQYKSQQYKQTYTQSKSLKSKIQQDAPKIMQLDSLSQKRSQYLNKLKSMQQQQQQDQQLFLQLPKLKRKYNDISYKNQKYYNPGKSSDNQYTLYRTAANDSYNHTSQKNLTKYGIEPNPGPGVRCYRQLNKAFRNFISNKIPTAPHYMIFLYHLITDKKLHRKKNLQLVCDIHNNQFLGVNLTQVNDASTRNNLDLVKVQFAKDLQQFQYLRQDQYRIDRLLNQKQQIFKNKTYLQKLSTKKYSQNLLQKFTQPSKSNPAFLYDKFVSQKQSSQILQYIKKQFPQSSLNQHIVINNIIVDADTIKDRLKLGGIQLNPGPQACH